MKEDFEINYFRNTYILLSIFKGQSMFLSHIYTHTHTHIHTDKIDRYTYISTLIVQLVKNLPAMQETLVQFLGWEDSLEKEMATHSSTLAWKIPGTEEHGGLLWVAKSRTRLSDFTSLCTHRFPSQLNSLINNLV